MVDPVVFPDTVLTVVDWLDTHMSIPVRSKVPNPRPDAFIRVRRVGGPRRNIVTDEATLTVEAWAESAEEAHDLLQEARGLIHLLPEQAGNVKRVTEFAGPADLPDPLSEQPRYTFTVSVAERGFTRTSS